MCDVFYQPLLNNLHFLALKKNKCEKITEDFKCIISIIFKCKVNHNKVYGENDGNALAPSFLLVSKNVKNKSL